MRAPDFILIPALISSELWRRFSRRLRSGPLYRWRFAAGTPDGLTMAPQDLRPTDATLAEELYAGHFSFAEETVSTRGKSPFEVEPPNPEWTTKLHSFRWLRHLRAADTQLAHANAGAFVADWISIWGNRLDSDAWRADITAARLIAWFSHSPLLVKSATPENYQNLLRSLNRQARFLHHNAPYVRDGYPRLHAAIALAFAALCIAGREKSVKQASKELDRELIRQIMPDGGHISRNPLTVLNLLTDLLPLRQAFKNQGHPPSTTLLSAIDRMMGALRFFRHSNGDLAQFNGTGFTPSALLTTVLRYDENHSSTLKSAPQTGYERMASNHTVVLMDTGKPFNRGTARRAMAGTLSFELSSGNTRFIANCGIPENGFKLYAPFARATAAHSTLVINNKSSSRFATESKWHDLLPSPLIRCPNTVNVERQDGDDFMQVTASHDGYDSTFKCNHDRQISLSKDGTVLNGKDQIVFHSKPQSLDAAIRFHLPPAISASPLSSGHSILIASPDNEAWTFTCIDAEISLEESIQFSGPSLPRKTEQIVIHFNTGTQNEIRWTFEKRSKKPNPRERKKTKAQQAMPDLLDSLLPKGGPKSPAS